MSHPGPPRHSHPYRTARFGTACVASRKSRARAVPDSFPPSKGVTMSIVEQPAPIANDSRPTWMLVIEDIPLYFGKTSTASLVIADAAARDTIGRQRYGVPLQPGNGRDSLRDALDEAMDLAVYLKNALVEVSAMPDAEPDEEAFRDLLGVALKSQYGTALRMCVGLRDLIWRRDALVNGKDHP
jgi:hypothetical protein